MTISFPRVAIVQHGYIELLEDYTVEFIPDSPWPNSLTVPAGEVSDGASIPRGLWWLFGPPIRSEHLPAALCHDYLCRQSNELNSYQQRVFADAVFLVLLHACGVGIVKRSFMHSAVVWYRRFNGLSRLGKAGVLAVWYWYRRGRNVVRRWKK